MTQEIKEEDIEDVIMGEGGVLIPESEIEKEEEMSQEEVEANINSMARLLKDRSDECERDAIKLRGEIAEKEIELSNLKKSVGVSTDEKIHDKIKIQETMLNSSKYLLKYILEAGIFNEKTIAKDADKIISIFIDVITGKKRLHSKQVNDIVFALNGTKPSDNFEKLIERGKAAYVQKLKTFYHMRSKNTKAFIDVLRLIDEKLSLISTEYFKIFDNLDIGRLLYMMRAVFIIYFQYMIEENISRSGNKFKSKNEKLDDCKVAAERFFIIMQAHALSAERVRFLSELVDFIMFAKGYPNPQYVDAKTVCRDNGFKLSDREPLIVMQLLVEKEDKDLILTEEYKALLEAEIKASEAGEAPIEKDFDETAKEFNDSIREQLGPGEFEEVQ